MNNIGDWENSCLCLEDGIEPATSNLINLQSIYNQCLGVINMVSEEQVTYCKCGCGQITKISQRTGTSNIYVFGHSNKGKSLSDDHKRQIGNANRGSHSNLGHELTDEHKQKLSDAHKGISTWNKGISPSEETREKIRNTLKGNIPWNKGLTAEMDERVRIVTENLAKSNRGRKCTPKAIENMKGHTPWNKGLKNCYNEDTLKQMSESLTGRHHTQQTKMKISNTMQGENNRLWQGGISFEPYCHKFNNNMKERVRNKHNRTCFLCGEKENEQKLCVHHVDYHKKQGCGEHEWRLVPLCRGCHARTNTNREQWELYFQKRISLIDSFGTNMDISYN